MHALAGFSRWRRQWLAFDRIDGYWWCHIGGLVVYGKSLRAFSLSFSERNGHRKHFVCLGWLFGAYVI